MKTLWSLLSVSLYILGSDLYVGGVRGDGCRTKDGGCCIMCEPGYFLSRKCGPCKPCPSNGYMDHANNVPTCHRCQKCERILEYRSTCSATQNAVCKCIAGKRCSNEKCTMCEDNPCPAGTMLSGEGCVKCPLGTFNSGTERTCQPWKNCSAIDAIIHVNGNSTSDVVCVPKLTNVPSTSSTFTSMTTKKPEVAPYDLSIVIAVASVISIIMASMAIYMCLSLRLEKIKNKFKKIKHIEQEDACSYHYPEEEHGGEEETLSPEP
ncbi:tumor necrosis factor receptor superfamily member 9 [Mantella aurantiaca]